MSRREIREHLFRLLFRREFHDSQELREQTALYFEALEKCPSLDEQDYISERLYKVMDKVPEIDQKLDNVSKGWRLNRMGKVDLTILRLAAFEIFFDDDIPVGVAINEAVEIAKKYGEEHSASFINGILGRLVSNEDAEEAESQEAGGTV